MKLFQFHIMISYMKFLYMKSLCEISVIEMAHVNIMKPILNQGQLSR